MFLKQSDSLDEFNWLKNEVCQVLSKKGSSTLSFMVTSSSFSCFLETACMSLSECQIQVRNQCYLSLWEQIF